MQAGGDVRPQFTKEARAVAGIRVFITCGRYESRCH